MKDKIAVIGCLVSIILDASFIYNNLNVSLLDVVFGIIGVAGTFCALAVIGEK